MFFYKRILTLSHLFLLLSIFTSHSIVLRAEEGKRNKYKCSGNCSNGRGTFSWQDGSTYSGEWKGEQPHGKGTMKYLDTSWYKGNWVRGVYEGQGKLFFVSKGTYEGNFLEGNLSGYGTYKYLNGNKYQGNWKDNLWSGKGTITWRDSASYTGTFSNSLLRGKGIYSSKKSGAVACYWSSADKICVYGNCKKSKGVLLSINGLRYQGVFADGKYNGIGTLFFPDYRKNKKGIWKRGKFLASKRVAAKEEAAKEKAAKEKTAKEKRPKEKGPKEKYRSIGSFLFHFPIAQALFASPVTYQTLGLPTSYFSNLGFSLHLGSARNPKYQAELGYEIYSTQSGISFADSATTKIGLVTYFNLSKKKKNPNDKLSFNFGYIQTRGFIEDSRQETFVGGGSSAGATYALAGPYLGFSYYHEIKKKKKPIIIGVNLTLTLYQVLNFVPDSLFSEELIIQNIGDFDTLSASFFVGRRF